MIKWVLFQSAGQKSKLLQTEHHLVHDGISAGVLLGDILESYDLRLEGRRLSGHELQGVVEMRRNMPNISNGSSVSEAVMSAGRMNLPITLLASRHRAPYRLIMKGCASRPGRGAASINTLTLGEWENCGACRMN